MRGRNWNEIYKNCFLTNEFEVEKYEIDRFHEKFKLNEIRIPIVFVCSTTGEGQVPLKAREFLKFIEDSKYTLNLFNLNYAMLGLGDSSFPIFCGGPKSIHLKFQELGANCFYGPLYSDDHDNNSIEEIFKKEILNKIRIYYRTQSNSCNII